VQLSGDGKSDILWWKTMPGLGPDNVYLWEMDGHAILASGNGQPVGWPSGWTTEGAGDFDGDGFADVLIRERSTNAVGVWEMDGRSQVAAGIVGTIPTSDGQIAAIRDFNGDGRDDLLLLRPNGDVSIWMMNGVNAADPGLPVANYQPGSGWTFLRAADMTGDGRTDLLWRNVSSGQIVFWEMNGWEIVTTDSVSVTYNGSSWYPQPDVGDFNRDGRDETLWRSSVDGTLVMLETNRGVLVDGSALADSVPSPRSLAPLEPQSSAGGGGGGELALLKMIGRSGMLSQSAETPATDKPWKVLTGLPPYWLAPAGPIPQFAVPPVPHIMAIQPSLRPHGPPRVPPGSPPPWQPRAPNAPTGSVVASTSMQSAASVVEPTNELPVEESAARFTSTPLSDPSQWRYSLYSPELSLLAETNLVATTTTPSIAYEYAWFGGEPLAQSEVSPSTETVRYYFNDHLGAPVLLASQGGAVQWRVEREPYGRIQ
jgi:hypothetical protein